MTESTIKKLWTDYNFSNCDDCGNEDCKGRLDYDNLCINLNYLKQYGQIITRKTQKHLQN